MNRRDFITKSISAGVLAGVGLPLLAQQGDAKLSKRANIVNVALLFAVDSEIPSRSPRRLLPQIQDGFNRKGLISDKGQRKEAFYVLQNWYKQKK